MSEKEPEVNYASIKINFTPEMRVAESLDIKKPIIIDTVASFPQHGGFGENPLPPKDVEIKFYISGQMFAFNNEEREESIWIDLDPKNAETFFAKMTKAMQDYYSTKARYGKWIEEQTKKLPPVDAHPEDVM